MFGNNTFNERFAVPIPPRAPLEVCSEVLALTNVYIIRHAHRRHPKDISQRHANFFYLMYFKRSRLINLFFKQEPLFISVCFAHSEGHRNICQRQFCLCF
jgi:hypothetical protein